MSQTFSSVKEVLSVVFYICEVLAVISRAKNKVRRRNFSTKRTEAVITYRKETKRSSSGCAYVRGLIRKSG